MNPGDYVTVQAYGGEQIRRRVVEVSDSMVFVCLEEEFRDAEDEGRQPEAIGFPKEFLIDVVSETT